MRRRFKLRILKIANVRKMEEYVVMEIIANVKRKSKLSRKPMN